VLAVKDKAGAKLVQPGGPPWAAMAAIIGQAMRPNEEKTGPGLGRL